jgi:hypothetical protein
VLTEIVVAPVAAEEKKPSAQAVALVMVTAASLLCRINKMNDD